MQDCKTAIIGMAASAAASAPSWLDRAEQWLRITSLLVSLTIALITLRKLARKKNSKSEVRNPKQTGENGNGEIRFEQGVRAGLATEETEELESEQVRK